MTNFENRRPNIDVSDECLDAIKLLLKKDKQERMTIFEFLHHPWLQNYQKWKNRKMWANSYSDESSNQGSNDENISLRSAKISDISDPRQAAAIHNHC